MFVCPSTCQKNKGIFLQSSQKNLAELLEVKLLKVGGVSLRPGCQEFLTLKAPTLSLQQLVNYPFKCSYPY